MTLFRSTVLATAALLLAAAPAFATDFFVFKASITLPASMVVERPSQPTDLFVTRKITGNDLVNLALGRPIGTKLDKNTEIFAVAITFPEDGVLGRIIVFDPSQNGPAQIKATIGHMTNFDYTSGFKSSSNAGFAIGSLAIDATVLGNPGQNGLLASTLTGGGAGSSPFGFGQIDKVAGKAVITGRLRFNSQGAGFDGVVTGGKGKASGKPLGTFSQ